MASRRNSGACGFHLDLADMNYRHHLTFDTYEIGKLSLDDYLDRTVFYQPRGASLTIQGSGSVSTPMVVPWKKSIHDNPNRR